MKKIETIVINVVLLIKLINQFRIYDKITIVTIICHSSFFIIARIVFTIIKNINFATSINVSTTSKVNHELLRRYSFNNSYLFFDNFYV